MLHVIFRCKLKKTLVKRWTPCEYLRRTRKSVVRCPSPLLGYYSHLVLAWASCAKVFLKANNCPRDEDVQCCRLLQLVVARVYTYAAFATWSYMIPARASFRKRGHELLFLILVPDESSSGSVVERTRSAFKVQCSWMAKDGCDTMPERGTFIFDECPDTSISTSICAKEHERWNRRQGKSRYICATRILLMRSRAATG